MRKNTESQDELVKEIESLKKRVAELENMEKEFISDVSHELRTPLSIIKEGVSLVLDRVPGEINEQQAKILTMAKNNIDRLVGIINELLHYKGGKNGK